MPSSTLEPGSVLSGDGGEYELLKQLGRGAYGRMFQTRVLSGDFQGRLAALKVVELYSDPEVRKEVEDTFNNEATVLAALDHPNLAHLLAKDSVLIEHNGKPTRVPALVMELIQGADLDDVMRARHREPLSWQHVAHIGQRVAEGLAYAHERGILHRDVKPANIVLSDKGEVVLVDLGLAKTSYLAAQHHTRLRGTKRFWGPEVLREEKLGPESDVFALGLCAFELLTGGEHPYYDSDPDVFRDNLLTGRAVCSLRDYDIPMDPVAIVECAIQPDPKNRFRDARAMANAWSEVEQDASSLGRLAATTAQSLERLSRAADMSSDGSQYEEAGNDDETRINDAHRKRTRGAITAEVVEAIGAGVPEGELDSQIREDLSKLARLALQEQQQQEQPPQPEARKASRRTRRTTVHEFTEEAPAAISEAPIIFSPVPEPSLPATATTADPDAAEAPPLQGEAPPPQQSETVESSVPRRRAPKWAAGALAAVVMLLGASALWPSPETAAEPKPLPRGSHEEQEAPEALTQAPPAPSPPPAAQEAKPATAPMPETTAAPEAVPVGDDNSPTGEPAVEEPRPNSRTDNSKARQRRNAAAARAKDKPQESSPTGTVVPISIGVIPAGTISISGRGVVGEAPLTLELPVGSRVRVTARYNDRHKTQTLVVPPYPENLVIDLR